MSPKQQKEYVNPFSPRTKEQYNFARQMRRDPMRTEAKLWRALRGLQLGVKFRRQHLVGPFIVDFYCNELKLAVEIDGNIHGVDNIREKDRAREQWLLTRGYNVIRFTSHDVYHHLEGVLTQLSTYIESLKKIDPL